jgi:hypothetical protein
MLQKEWEKVFNFYYLSKPIQVCEPKKLFYNTIGVDTIGVGV